MTPIELLEIGDEVTFEVNPEYRAWSNTYNRVPDGTKGIVCGFSDVIIYQPRVPASALHRPGVYHQKGAASVWLQNGLVVPGGSFITMVDQAEQQRRDTAARDNNGILQTRRIRLGDLPETRFWEHDKVRVRLPHRSRSEDMLVVSIDYDDIHKALSDDSPFPIYTVQDANGCVTKVAGSWIELLERGNVWRHCHGEPLVFADLKEEASFSQLIGETESVRNPVSGYYGWTKNAALDAIERGIAHGLSIANSRLAVGRYFEAVRFHDEELGQRVAKETLEGFILP